MSNRLLPIGSVISLYGAKKKMMIIGSGVKVVDTNTVYDYIAVPFPEGYIDSEKMFLCYAKDVENVHFVGFVNTETQVHLHNYAAQLKEAELEESSK